MKYNHFAYNTHGKQNGAVHIFLRSPSVTFQDKEKKIGGIWVGGLLNYLLTQKMCLSLPSSLCLVLLFQLSSIKELMSNKNTSQFGKQFEHCLLLEKTRALQTA